MSSSERSKAARKTELPVLNEPKETNSIIFEWPLRGLKQVFDSCKGDTKSRVIKSAPFGGGRWTVLFYAQSGLEQFCSLYLNAEPLPNERVHPLLASASATTDLSREGAVGNSRSKGDNALEEKWDRKGVFRFTFNIQTIEERTTLGTKEAHDHAFSHKTSNWGWAQFAKRDHVYYKNSEVVREDGFLITVTITSSPEKPRMADPISHIVPPVLVQAMGSLLDDPEHSDVVFHLHPSRRRVKAGSAEVQKVYAIRKILAARSDYFRLMFDGGFQEAEVEDSSDEDDYAPAHPSRSHDAAARAEMASKSAARISRSASAYDVGEDGYLSENDEDGQDPFVEDSDEDIEIADADYGSSYPNRTHTPADSSQRDYAGSIDHSPNEDEDADQERDDPDVEETSDEDQERVSTAAAASATMGTGSSGHLYPDSRDAAPSGLQTPSTRHTDKAFGDGEVMLTPQSNRKVAHYDASYASSTSSAPRPSSGDPTLSPIVPVPSPPSVKRERARTSVVTAAAEPVSSRQRSARRHVDRRKRRKVNVLDSAYPTFKALLFFLYTDTVEFAPLTSSFLPADMAAADDLADTSGPVNLFGPTSSARRGRETVGSIAEEMAKAHRKRKTVIDAYRERNPDKPSPCSAKAMYRLADKLDIPDLKRRAQEHIQMSLTVHNIVWEVFSGFNTQYPDVRKMETDFLLKHWPLVKRSSAMKSIFLRSSAHPGLAEVWPHLLEYLEYRQPDVDETDEAA